MLEQPEPTEKTITIDQSAWVHVAEVLTQLDDPLLALKVLDTVPAIWRDNPPPAFQMMKADITKALFTARKYVDHHGDSNVREHGNAQLIQGLHRGSAIAKMVQSFNERDHKALIVDCGPGDYWLPLGLKELGLDFDYTPLHLNSAAHDKFRAYLAAKEIKIEPVTHLDGPLVFVACELIEHLYDPKELVIESLQHGEPDVLILSTPNGTFDVHPDWRQTGLPHVRTYTPSEFMQEVTRLWPAYKWSIELPAKEPMLAVGHKVGSDYVE